MQLLSYSAYALWITRLLAESEKPTNRAKLGERLGIDEGFVQQVLIRLMKAGLVSSVRGFYGGYVLAKRPKDITIEAVIEAAAKRPVFQREDDQPPLLNEARRRMRKRVAPCLKGSILDWELPPRP